MRYLVLGALVATAAAAPALAQGDRAPFTGAHAEVLSGYDHVGGSDSGADGLTYGGALGYDFQTGRAVFGVDGEVSGATTAATDTNVLAAGDSVRFKADRDLYAGVKVGVAVGPSTLLYAKGGYTNARFKTTYNNGAGAITTSGNNLDGYRLGAGIEQKFNLLGPSGFVRAEYRYSNYKNLNAGNQNIDIDLDRHQALVGLGVRF